MAIILEGIDGMGKTTYARKLSNFLNLPYIYFPRPKHKEQNTEEWIRYAFKLMRDYKENFKNFILDRSVISSVVYSYDYYNNYKEALKQVIDMGYYVIFMMPKTDRYADFLFIHRYWEVAHLLQEYNPNAVHIQVSERYEYPDTPIKFE